MATEITDNVQRPVQIDYKLRQVVSPRYKMMRIPLNTYPSGTLTIGNNTSTTLEWKLPTQIYNLSRSYIQYSIKVGSSGVGKYNWSHEDVFDLGERITFGAASGMDLVHLQ